MEIKLRPPPPPPHIHKAEICQDNRIILYEGVKLENQHTRKILGTLSWVYKPSDYSMVIGGGNPCWSYWSQDLHPTKTVRHRDAHSSAMSREVTSHPIRGLSMGVSSVPDDLEETGTYWT